MGPNGTVRHYQFRKVKGVVQIHPGRKSTAEPTFKGYKQCLDFYLYVSLFGAGNCALLLFLRVHACGRICVAHVERICYGLAFSHF